MVNCTVTCGDMLLYNIKSHETHINSSFINKMTITNTLCTHPFFRWHVSAASANDSVVLFMMSTGNFSIVDLALLLNSLYVSCFDFMLSCIFVKFFSYQVKHAFHWIKIRGTWRYTKHFTVNRCHWYLRCFWILSWITVLQELVCGFHGFTISLWKSF